MELIQDFKRIMDETYKIALATSVMPISPMLES